MWYWAKAHVFMTSIFFSSIRVRLTCFCRLLFGCFFNSRLVLPNGAKMNLPSGGSRPKFCIFWFHFFEYNVLHKKLNMRKTESSSFLLMVFSFSWLPLSHDLNGLQTSIKDVQERNHSWTELLAINIVSIYILILAVCLIFHNKVYKN